MSSLAASQRALVVVGTQWGDEGKGKVVDLCAQGAEVVARYAGGSNAGHTLIAQGRKLVLHLIPSGVLHPGRWLVLGDGMVIDPWELWAELASLEAAGVELRPERLLISSRAHLVLPYHRQLDELKETTAAAIGTTRRGIGPAYEDKAGRRGVRAGDLVHPERLRARLQRALEEANGRLTRFGRSPVELEGLYHSLQEVGERLGRHLADTSLFLCRSLEHGQRVLLEGAQGALLDLDHGTYPYVTSSTTLAGGVAAGGGVPARLIGEVLGVAKAYVTRVGDGPFPTELGGALAEQLRATGAEFGATTGRPRRCGWLDLPALRYAVRVSGVTQLALTKLDVLAGIHPLKICTGYTMDGHPVEDFPADADELAQVRPVLETLEGFDEKVTSVEAYEALPAGARAYVERIESELGIPVSLISFGPDREQTVLRREPWPREQPSR